MILTTAVLKSIIHRIGQGIEVVAPYIA